MPGKLTLSGKPALYGLLALSAMEVAASQPPDSPLALLQQPNENVDASTPSSAIASSEKPPSPSAPSIEPTSAPRFSAALNPTPSDGSMRHRSPQSIQAAIASPTRFPDVQAHWAQPFVELLAARGIVSGYGDGTFQPDRSIEVAHFGSMLQQAQRYRLRALRRKQGIVSASATGNMEPSPAVTETEAAQLLQAYDIRTRAQAAVFIYRNFQSPAVSYSAVVPNPMDSETEQQQQQKQVPGANPAVEVAEAKRFPAGFSESS